MNIIILAVLIFIIYYIIKGLSRRTQGHSKEDFQTTLDPIECLCRNSDSFLELHTDVCKGKISTNTLNSCGNLAYLNSNQKTCRTLGYEPCKNLDYAKSNKDECKALGYHPCSLNPDIKYSPGSTTSIYRFPEYIRNFTNKDECRALGYEPCRDPVYLTTNAETDCLNKNYDACKISTTYLKNNFQKCKDRGTNACIDPRTPEFATQNPTLCPTLGSSPSVAK